MSPRLLLLAATALVPAACGAAEGHAATTPGPGAAARSAAATGAATIRRSAAASGATATPRAPSSQRVAVRVVLRRTGWLSVGVQAPCAPVRVTLTLTGHRPTVARLGRGARADLLVRGRVRRGHHRLRLRARATGRPSCSVLLRAARPRRVAGPAQPPRSTGGEPVVAAAPPAVVPGASSPIPAAPLPAAPPAAPEPDPCGDTAAATPTPAPARARTTPRRVPVGAAVAGWLAVQNPAYRQAYADHFDALTPENELKMDVIRSGEDRYDFSQAETLMDLAAETGTTVRGHTLVWGEQLPWWVANRAWTRDTLRAFLHDYITTVVCHFRGRIDTWDVVNEVTGDDGGMRQTLWQRVIGDDYVADAFRWAHAADPSAALYLNDYYTEYGGAKAASQLALLRGLVAQGVPVGGVGLQLHSDTAGHAPTQTQVARAMQEYASLGLDSAVTEMDVSERYATGTEAENDAAAAEVYRGAAAACAEQPRCRAFTVWGVDDGHTWSGSASRPLLLDAGYAAKPAWTAVTALLRP